MSPRIGHFRITVDDVPWRFVDGSRETAILVEPTPEPQNVLFELADPTHEVITGETLKLALPEPKAL